MANLVELIREKVISGPKPAVYISGGLDSTITLHHLREKYTGDIYTYHAEFGVDEDECDKARKIARHYGTIHKQIKIDKYLETLPEIMRFFEAPRYNVWPYWLARQAKADGRETIYIGEGSDELFGGYHDRDYLHGWSSQIEFVQYTYDQIHRHLGLTLRRPFYGIDWRAVLDYFSPPDKGQLRAIYKDVLGPDILNLATSQPPPMAQVYWRLWKSDISKHFPGNRPETTKDIKKLLQLLVTKIWVDERHKYYREHMGAPDEGISNS